MTRYLSDDARQIGRPTQGDATRARRRESHTSAARFLIKKTFPDILQSVSNGSSLADSLKFHGIAWVSFFRYLGRSPEHRNAYARARQMRVEKWIDEMVPMTDKVIGQEMAIVAATRNAVDVRKWVASRLMPNQYGDQPSGVTINNQTNVMVVSEERLRHLQEVRRKMIDGQKSEVG